MRGPSFAMARFTYRFSSVRLKLFSALAMAERTTRPSGSDVDFGRFSRIAMVWPTMIGRIIDGRDQVFTTFFSFREFSMSIFSLRDFSTKGPFFTDRLIAQSPAAPGDTPQAE